MLFKIRDLDAFKSKVLKNTIFKGCIAVIVRIVVSKIRDLDAYKSKVLKYTVFEGCVVIKV